MDEFTTLGQWIDGISIGAVLLYIWSVERRDHRDTRTQLEAVHEEHKKDLRSPAPEQNRIPPEYE